MLTFSIKVLYYWKWLSFCKICLFLEKCDLLCEGLYTLTKCQNLIKTFNFLGYVNLFNVIIFIKWLLENCYFDSKYHFLQWYFGQECHFPSKIYITLGMNSLEKLSNFLRMVLIYLSILGKMTIGFRSILVVNSEKMAICFRSVNFFIMWASLVKAKMLQKQQFWRIFFIFVANGHHFQKC